MPRKNRTFSEKDVLRIVRKNLTVNEQKAVIIALCEGVAIEEIKGELVIVPLSSLEDAMEEAGIVEWIIDIIMSVLLRFK